jgi:hypothetical protein
MNRERDSREEGKDFEVKGLPNFRVRVIEKVWLAKIAAKGKVESGFYGLGFVAVSNAKD